MPNHFTLLGILPSFDINNALLDQNYRALQRELHPDRFVGKPEQERTQSLQRSITVNEAYSTLKDPFKRGEYLLSLQGIVVKEGRGSVKPSQAVLMAMMELRERLEEAKTGEALQAISAEVEKEKCALIEAVSACFAAQNYEQAAQDIIHLRYLDKAGEEITLKRRRGFWEDMTLVSTQK